MSGDRRAVGDEPKVHRLGVDGPSCLIVMKSQPAKELFRRIAIAARSDTNVLITGETGTGKDVIARLIHFLSCRSTKPFIAQNCAAIPADLLESELFGVRRGAFTGATLDRQGLFGAASGGTILLDEISEIVPAMQAKLLRVVEDKMVRPIGSVLPRRIDVRVVSASNGNLERRMQTGEFRGDLFYRLSGSHIEVPPLRERREDVGAFIDYFINRGREGSGVDDAAREMLTMHPWPGNIRQLENVVCTALASTDSHTITPADLPPTFRIGQLRQDTTSSHWVVAADIRLQMEAAQREKLIVALMRSQGNKSKAARALGLSRASLYYNLRKHNLG
jgi:transcriptional regulator with PAS, ATPase and Fis domain